MFPEKVTLNGQYAARFLEKIYAGCNKKFVLKRKYNIYKQLKTELSRRAKIAEEAYLIAHMKNLVLQAIDVHEKSKVLKWNCKKMPDWYHKMMTSNVTFTFNCSIVYMYSLENL